MDALHKSTYGCEVRKLLEENGSQMMEKKVPLRRRRRTKRVSGWYGPSSWDAFESIRPPFLKKLRRRETQAPNTFQREPSRIIVT
jgi:hypothetical protein